ncbi:hypothetical protein [Pseudomonas sp. efr-133-TYG-5]|uniref:hypothetical protein n=1 Tax=Pseudomonas sp. efr-133-TYG-5 TaxID=3040310 RepID=UPI002552B74E|nr:hypothetical protein [Pseudomonas sp. efr-133-TYG-5]
MQRSEPWIAAQQSIAQDTQFVAWQIELNRFFLFKLCLIAQTGPAKAPFPALSRLER